MPRGTTVRRVYPHSPHEIFIAVRHPDGARMLTLAVSTQAAARPAASSTRCRAPAGWRCSSPGWTATDGELRVVLTDASLREVFNPLASDIAATAHAQPDAVDGGARCGRPVRALAADAAEHRTTRAVTPGTAGPVRRAVIPPRPPARKPARPAEAVRAWTGPTGAHQDFQLPRAAIEVKTSSGKEPQTLVDQQ